MSNFLADQRLEIGVFIDPTTGKKTWVTSREYGFVLGGEYETMDGHLFIVPQYFETDLGSIPWWLRWLFNPSDPRRCRAYVTHDYVNKLTASRPPGPGVWSSQVACGVLYDALRLDGDSVWSCCAHFVGVFLGIAKKER